MKRYFSATDIIGNACSIMNKNLLMFLIVYILMEIVSSIFNSFAAPNLSMFTTYKASELQELYSMLSNTYLSPWAWVSVLVQVVFMVGLSTMAFNAIDGKKAGFDAFKMPIEVYLKFIATWIIYVFIVCVGLAFCILPGIFLAIRLEFTPFYMIDKNLSIDEAFKESWRNTSGNFWHLLGTNILFSIFAMAGFLLCCVGAFYTFPAFYVALCLLTRVFSNNEQVEEAYTYE